MKKINIENIDKLIDKNQYGSNSELYEFKMFNLSSLDDIYSITFNYTNNTSGLMYNGYFDLNRAIINYTDERGRDTDVCELKVIFWENSQIKHSIQKNTVIPMHMIRHYDLLYLFLRSYINEIIG